MWQSDESMRGLRDNTTLITKIDTDVHGMIHKDLAIVQPMDRYTARRALSMHEGVPGDPLGSIDRLIDSIHEAMTHHVPILSMISAH